uniref:Seminal fluid protein HACP007 n=1 Tax=Heliconius melpomene TaxID=34740 RepID=D9HQ67_HELME|nr:seminal fluid protein HACP007 [Heliconius melpomene]
MLRLLIFILYVSTSFGLSKSNGTEGRIVKGYKVAVYKYPHAGFMHFRKHVPTACGSSLFMVQAVVTAAHCLDEINYNNGDINIFFGASIPLHAEIVRKVANFHIHPKYNAEKGQYNLGIGFLNAPVPLSDFISKIPIATKTPMVNDALYTSGWGKQVPQKLPDYSDLRHLKASKQRVISLRDCEGYTGMKMSSAYWCTLSINGYHYHGDAGNGLVSKDKFLVGVVSYMIDDITMYSDVTREVKWMKKICSVTL